jgi:hypothetical protein
MGWNVFVIVYVAFVTSVTCVTSLSFAINIFRIRNSNQVYPSQYIVYHTALLLSTPGDISPLRQVLILGNRPINRPDIPLHRARSNRVSQPLGTFEMHSFVHRRPPRNQPIHAILSVHQYETSAYQHA